MKDNVMIKKNLIKDKTFCTHFSKDDLKCVNYGAREIVHPLRSSINMTVYSGSGSVPHI